MTAHRVLAVHLPQFHPTPENDEWWGKGFTEWTNVAKSRPWFPGHHQPRLPGELGFYDLRVPEVRVAQADLAREHGIHGFLYYHYWFHGRRALHRPVDEIVASGEPDFPFCLCWANEDWTRSWTSDGSGKLIQQRYSPEDDLAHIRFLLPIFTDRRYVKVRGMPVFFVYRASRIPEPARTFDRFREEARRYGFPDLHIVRFESSGEYGDPRALGADAAAEFQPDRRCLGEEVPRHLPLAVLRRLRLIPKPLRALSFRRYETLVERSLARPIPPYRFYPGVTPGWDNTPRRAGGQSGAWLMLGSTPDAYARWLRETLRRFPAGDSEENLVIINAWNEWAEGNLLEPCARWGRRFLEATREVLREAEPVRASQASTSRATTRSGAR